MKRKPIIVPDPPEFTRADMDTIAAMGLNVLRYHNRTLENHYVPRDILGTADGTTAILWTTTPENGYSFDGWQAFHARRNNGVCRELAQALAWLQRSRDIDAGKATDFRGR